MVGVPATLLIAVPFAAPLRKLAFCTAACTLAYEATVTSTSIMLGAAYMSVKLPYSDMRFKLYLFRLISARSEGFSFGFDPSPSLGPSLWN